MLFKFNSQALRYVWTVCMAMLVSASSVTAAEPRNYPIRPITQGWLHRAFDFHCAYTKSVLVSQHRV